METKKTKRDTKGPKEHKKSWQETYASIDDIMTPYDVLQQDADGVAAHQ